MATAFPKIEPNRGMIKAGIRSDPVNQIPLIRKVDCIGKVDKGNKGRWPAGDLDGIIKFDPPAPMQGWFIVADGPFKNSVQGSGIDSGRIVFINLVDQLKNPTDTQPGFGRNRHGRCKAQEFGCRSQPFDILTGGMGILLYDIPFI